MFEKLKGETSNGKRRYKQGRCKTRSRTKEKSFIREDSRRQSGTQTAHDDILPAITNLIYKDPQKTQN